MSRTAEVYEAFQAAPASGRQFGWWLISRDVTGELAVEHRQRWPLEPLLLGRPVRVVDGDDVLRFVPSTHRPARKYRKLRLR